MNVSQIKARIASLLDCSMQDIILNKTKDKTQKGGFITKNKNGQYVITYADLATLVHEFFHACFTPDNQSSSLLYNALEDLRIDKVARYYDPELANVVTDDIEDHIESIANETKDPYMAGLKAVSVPLSLDNAPLMDKVILEDKNTEERFKKAIQDARDVIDRNPNSYGMKEAYSFLESFLPDEAKQDRKQNGEGEGDGEGNQQYKDYDNDMESIDNVPTEQKPDSEGKIPGYGTPLEYLKRKIQRNITEKLSGTMDMPTLSQATRIKKGIRQIIQNKAIGKRENSNRGKLNTKRLGRFPSNFLFTKKDRPTPETKLFVLVDLSGSMEGSKLDTVIKFVNTLRTVKENNLKIELRGFNSMYFKNEEIGKNYAQVKEMNLYKTDVNTRDAAASYNDDAHYLKVIREELLGDKTPNKALLILSDGAFASSGVFKESNNSDMRREAKLLDDYQIRYVSIGILDRSVKEYYKNNITVDNIEQLADIMARKIRELIK